MDAATFATIFVAWWVGHSVGDHWVQTSEQSNTKGQRNWVGRTACASHVVTLQVTKAFTLGAAWLALGLDLNPGWVFAAWLLDGVSHYWADRRFTLQALADNLGKSEFYHLGEDTLHEGDRPNGCHIGTGKYALDQSWHHAWLFVASLIAVI